MAWNTPRTWATNEVLTSANMNTYVSDDLRWLGVDLPRASLAGSLTVPPGSTFATPTSGSWSATGTGGMAVSTLYAGSTSYFLTAPVAGAYQINASVIYTTNASGKRGLALSSGAAGTGTVWAQAQTEPVQSTEVTALSVSCLVQLPFGNSVHIGIRQSSGGSMTCAVRLSGFWVAV